MIMNTKKSVLTLVVLVIFVLMSASVLALPAPIGVLGTITDGGEPLIGIEVVLKAYAGDERVAVSEPVFTNQDGMFYAMVTLNENVPVDIQIIISSEESYAELVEGAVGWERYEVFMELSGETLGVVAPLPEQPIPTIVAFEEDLDALTEEDGGTSDILIEKYNINITEKPVLPVEENPVFVPAPEKEHSSRIILEIVAVLVFLMLMFVVRYEVHRRR